MKIKKAIEILTMYLEKDKETVEYYNNEIEGAILEIFEDSIGAYEVAIEALDKQVEKIPIKMYEDKNNKNVWRCPICNLPNIYPEDNYCLHCGQKLDWSVEE